LFSRPIINFHPGVGDLFSKFLFFLVEITKVKTQKTNKNQLQIPKYQMKRIEFIGL